MHPLYIILLSRDYNFKNVCKDFGKYLLFVCNLCKIIVFFYCCYILLINFAVKIYVKSKLFTIMKNLNKKTKLAKSMHDFAVLDAKILAQKKCTLNVPDELTANCLNENVITIHSSLKEINAALLEAGRENYTKFVAINAFRAKFSELYKIYSCNIEDEIENMLIVTCDLSHDLDGNENTPIKCIQSYISFGVKYGEICTPIRKENERYIEGIKAINKEIKKEHKNKVKTSAKNEAKFTKEQWIENKTHELITAGVPVDMAKNVAENLYKNLPTL